MPSDRDILAGVDWPPTVFDADTTTQLNVADTGYVTGTPTLAVTFRAPTSGRVLLTVGGGIRDNGGSNRGFISPQVFADRIDGEEVVAPSVEEHGLGSPDTASGYWYGSRATMLEGLDAGRVYIARVMHHVTGGSTVDIGRREIMVEPCP